METLDLTSYQTEFEEYLDKKNWIREPKNLYEPIEYIIQLSGKRIRPILTLMACPPAWRVRTDRWRVGRCAVRACIGADRRGEFCGQLGHLRRD